MTDPVAVLTVLGGFAVGIGLLEAWGTVARPVHAATGLSLPDDATGTLSSDCSKWVVTAVLVAYVLLVEGKGLGSLGVRYPDHLFGVDRYGGPVALVGWWLGGVVLTFVLTIGVYGLYRRFDLDTLESFAAEQAARSRRGRLFTAVTAGVTESVLLQAYPIERVAALSGSVLLAAAVSWFLFTSLHYGETFSAIETAYIGVPALSMTVLYVATGSVFVVILAHATVDAVSLLDAEGDTGTARGGEGDRASGPQS